MEACSLELKQKKQYIEWEKEISFVKSYPLPSYSYLAFGTAGVQEQQKREIND